MTNNTDEPGEQPLESWKEIAVYLKRDVRTVIRWEKREGLPVHRQMHQARSSVYAYPSELEAWKIDREPRLNAPPVITPWRRATSGFAIVAVMLLALLTMGSGPIRTPSAAAAVPPDGMSTRRLEIPSDTDVPESAVSPDGRYLSFPDWDTGNLAVRDLRTGKDRLLTSDGTEGKEDAKVYQAAEESRWSPDGKQIAYAWYVASDGKIRGELRVIGAAGGKARVLAQFEKTMAVSCLAWSPDGKKILATVYPKDGSKQMVMVSTTDATTRVLTELKREIFPTTKRFSPDSRYIAYDWLPDPASPERDIYLMSVDTGKATPLIQHPGDDYLLGWSQDGRWLIFASDRTGTLGLWVVRMSGTKTRGEPRLIKTGMDRIVPVGLTRDGTLFYGVARATEDVYVADLDPRTGRVTGRPRKAIERYEGANYSPAYSPDGKYLAYSSRRGNSPSLCIRSLATGQERVFYKEIWKLGLRWIAGPKWSADSRFMIFGGSTSIGPASGYRVDLETGVITRILQSGLNERLMGGAYGPDGKIFFVRINSKKGFSEIVVLDLNSGEERQLYRLRKPESIRIALSPDGRWLSFINAGWGGMRSLKVMSTSGGEAKEIWNFGKTKRGMPTPYQTWTPEGRYIVFSSPETSDPRIWDLWRIRVDGGKPEKIGLQQRWGIYSLSFRPDGRRIAFASRGGASTDSELWAMENFLPATVASK